MLGGPLPSDDDRNARRRFSSGQRYAEGGLMSQADPMRLFTKARLCDDVEALNSCLPPHVAALARKDAEVLEETQPATT